MRFIYAEYNMYHNSVDVTAFDGLYLDGNMQMWVDAEDSLEIW